MRQAIPGPTKRTPIVLTAILLPVMVALLLQTGCIHTEINQGLSAQARGKPYHKILICSMSQDSGVGTAVESALRENLSHHAVTAETGRHLFYSKRTLTTDAVVAEIKDHRFDGILVTQRIEIPASSSTLKNVLLGPVSEQPQTEKETKSFTRIQDFAAAYLQLLRTNGPKQSEQQLKSSVTTEGIVGKEIEVQARADLLGIREDQTVWSTGGLIEGSPHRPIQEFIDSFAKTIETGLAQAKFISAQWADEHRFEGKE